MTDTTFDEYLTAFKKKQGLDGCPKPITYGEDAMREAFHTGRASGMERAAELANDFHGSIRPTEHIGSTYQMRAANRIMDIIRKEIKP